MSYDVTTYMKQNGRVFAPGLDKSYDRDKSWGSWGCVGGFFGKDFAHSTKVFRPGDPGFEELAKLYPWKEGKR